MRTLNKIVSRALVVASTIATLFIAGSVQAQTLKYAGILSGGTNNVPALATNSYALPTITTNVVLSNSVPISTNYLYGFANPASWNLTYSRLQTIQCSCGWNGAINGLGGNAVFRVDKSVDGATWINGVTNITVSSSTTNPATTFSTGTAAADVDSGGAVYWRIGQVGNTNAVNALTNLNAAIGSRIGL